MRPTIADIAKRAGDPRVPVVERLGMPAVMIGHPSGAGSARPRHHDGRAREPATTDCAAVRERDCPPRLVPDEARRAVS
ncbi:hypothetical protein ABGB18_18305 [Nonomuraea sp. B12E4]|uniref:hypothetical protein n=1 Tax=Nonomuraea sp. B12E4 TaxID=3153564 RepID=UPI00325D335A